MQKALIVIFSLLFILNNMAYAQKKIVAVATFSILADMVASVGGEAVVVQTLVAPNQDAHVFQPSPSDVKKLIAADIIFINGLNFEGWFDKMIATSATKSLVITATAGIKPRVLDHHHHTHEEHHEHHHYHHGVIDPHAWQSLKNAKIYVENIKVALQTIDPQNAVIYQRNADNYLARIMQLEKDTINALAVISTEKKRVISSHDAFGYFADEYGVEFLAPMGFASDQAPSASTVAKLIEQIRAHKIKVLFVENIKDPRILKQIEQDSNAFIGGKLYSDALSNDDEPANTYLNMFQHNVATLVAALQG